MSYPNRDSSGNYVDSLGTTVKTDTGQAPIGNSTGTTTSGDRVSWNGNTWSKTNS
jgi:hypothetical protein